MGHGPAAVASARPRLQWLGIPTYSESQKRRGPFRPCVLCSALARQASDCVLFKLRLGDLEMDFDLFNILGRAELSRESLRRSAEELRQIQRAAKAAKLAQGLTVLKTRKQRSQAKGMQDVEDLSGEDWGSESDRFSDEEMPADDADEGPASSSAGPDLSVFQLRGAGNRPGQCHGVRSRAPQLCQRLVRPAGAPSAGSDVAVETPYPARNL